MKMGLAIAGVVLLVLLLIIGGCSITTVSAGHVKVGTWFGKVQDNTLREGFHWVNPLLNFTSFDVRQKTYKFTQVPVPSQDQLTTMFDFSVQYRIDGALVAGIMRDTGSGYVEAGQGKRAELIDKAVKVHLIPKFMSTVREAGRGVERAELFYHKDIQAKMQTEIHNSVMAYCAPKGITVQAVMLRNVQLPQFISKAIESKKIREQEAEKQKAELERFKVEQEQKLAQAKAERLAAEEQAKQIRIMADAKSYEIRKINEAVASNPAYIQLEAIKAFQKIASDPSAKLYFLGDRQILPLMNIGADIGTARAPAAPARVAKR